MIDRAGASVNFVTKGNLPDSLSVEIGAELEFAPGIPLAGRGAPNKQIAHSYPLGRMIP